MQANSGSSSSVIASDVQRRTNQRRVILIMMILFNILTAGVAVIGKASSVEEAIGYEIGSLQLTIEHITHHRPFPFG